jgi:hypothetical protein
MNVRDRRYEVLRRTYSGVRFRNAFCDHLLVALLVASVPTVFALVPKGVEQEVIAESAEHKLIELTLNEFVPVHLVYFIFAFSYSALTT